MTGALPRRSERATTFHPAVGGALRASLEAVAEAHRGHHGAGRLRRAVAGHGPGTTVTRGELEERMLALCSRHGLPRPMVNQRVAGLEVDRRSAGDRRRDHRGGLSARVPRG